MNSQLAYDKAVYHVERDPMFKIKAAWVPGAQTPVTLALVTRDHRALGRALEANQQGANLVISMDWEGVQVLYAEILRLAQTMNLQLDKPQA